MSSLLLQRSLRAFFVASFLVPSLCLAQTIDGGQVATIADGGVERGISRDGGVADSDLEAILEQNIPPERLPQLETSLGVDEVELGQLIKVSITVTRRIGDRVHLRKLRKLGSFELIDRRLDDDAEGETQVIELDLISFEVGQLEVPPVELMVVLDDGRTGSVSTEPLAIRVIDPLANEVDPQARGDHQPIEVYTTDRRALWMLGSSIALLIAILLGMVIGRIRARMRMKSRPEPPPPPPRPPEEVALEKLGAIEGRDWLETGEIKTFNIAVSEAIREYLGGRYGFDSLELTTEELIVQLEEAIVRGVSRSELESFLQETDMVKFAKWRPEVEFNRELLRRAFVIVRKTTAAGGSTEILGAGTGAAPKSSSLVGRAEKGGGGNGSGDGDDGKGGTHGP